MTLEIGIDVVPQGRVKVYGKVAVDPPKSRAFKEELRLKAGLLRRGYKPLEGALRVELEIRRNKPKASRRYGDIDNLVKGILDGLNGILWRDDSQIVELEVKKMTAEEPRLKIRVEEKGNGQEEGT